MDGLGGLLVCEFCIRLECNPCGSDLCCSLYGVSVYRAVPLLFLNAIDIIRCSGHAAVDEISMQ